MYLQLQGIIEDVYSLGISYYDYKDISKAGNLIYNNKIRDFHAFIFMNSQNY